MQNFSNFLIKFEMEFKIEIKNDESNIFGLLCSFSDLQKPQGELDGKACAAVGQSSLMALYDTMFSQVYNVEQNGLMTLFDTCAVSTTLHR